MSTSPESPSAASTRRAANERPAAEFNLARWRWVELALILCVLFIEGGAPAPHVNETHYLTKAKHYWDPSYCPEDLFLNSADAHVVFYWTVGWLTLWLPLPAVAWTGRLAAWSLLAWAWRRLSIAVVPLPLASVLGAALLIGLIRHANFAGEWIVGGVEAKCFAYVFVLLGLESVVRRSWIGRRPRAFSADQGSALHHEGRTSCWSPWIWFGVASAFHVLVGGWAVIAALAVWALEPRAVRPRLVAMAPALIRGGVCALAGLLPALALDRSASPEAAAEAARIYVFERLPHHLAPLSMPAEELQGKALRFSVVLALFGILWMWSAHVDRAGGQADGNASDQPIMSLGGLQRLMRFAAVSALISVVGLLIELALIDRPLLAARLLRYYWYRQADVTVPLATALAVTALVADQLGRLSAPRWSAGRLSSAPTSQLEARTRWLRVVAATTPIAWASWSLVDTVIARGADPIPPADRRIADVTEWVAVCDWIREQTPRDAVFVIPRHAQSFKWYAGRADVANWKDIPQDAASVIAWRRRCRDLFESVDEYGAPVTVSTPERLGTQRVRTLAKRYGANYVVARQYPPLGLSQIYPTRKTHNSWYAVYAVDEERNDGKTAESSQP